MNQIAFIFDNFTVYWYNIILALAVLAGICFFMACCCHRGIRPAGAAAVVLLSVILSLVFNVLKKVRESPLHIIFQ